MDSNWTEWSQVVLYYAVMDLKIFQLKLTIFVSRIYLKIFRLSFLTKMNVGTEVTFWTRI